MIDKIISFFDQDNQFKQVWQLKLIKFDIDLDEEVKPYERYLAISHVVEDTKGNPGIRGHFYVTNLRFIWHAANDREMNLSIGLDTINNVYMKPTVQSKTMLIVKTQSPGGSKYEFKFSIFSQVETYVFKKAIQLFKQSVATKLYRTIDTNIKLNNETRKFETLPKEQIFNVYPQSKYYENEKIYDVDIVFTNVRLLILQTIANRGVSYGIPWIMLESYEKGSQWEHPVFQLKVRGLLSEKEIYIRTNKQTTKFQNEFMSLASAFSKNPYLGIDVSRAIEKDGTPSLNSIKTSTAAKDFDQTFETKINIKRNKNQYAAESSQGTLSNTFFNEELGLMMQNLPEGASRRSLWEILG